MSNETTDQDLKFDKAEFSSEQKQISCASCTRQIEKSYFVANQQSLCADCSEKLRIHFQRKSTAGDIFKALGFGFAASILGFIIYYAVLKITGYELSLISILVGFIVGKAVMIGSGRRGGVVFSLIAVFFTYLSIVSTYVPLIIEEARKTQPAAVATQTPIPGMAVPPQTARVTPAPKEPAASAAPADAMASQVNPKPSLGDFFLGIMILLGNTLAIPFLAGASNIIGLAIIGFALFEAVRQTRKIKLEISGPFEIASPQTSVL